MYTHVHAYVYYVCIHTCVYAHVYYVCIHTCACICVLCVYTHVCMHVCIMCVSERIHVAQHVYRGQRTTLGFKFLCSITFEAGFMLFTAAYANLGGPGTLGDSLVSDFFFLKQVCWDGRGTLPHLALGYVLEKHKTSVLLMNAQRMRHSLSHCRSLQVLLLPRQRLC